MTTARSTRVVVVGAGPAGSATATLLARAGVEVIVLEKCRHPRAKPCGATVNPGGVAALQRLGLLSALLPHHPAALRGWRILADGREATGRYGSGSRALGLPRTLLDSALVSEARQAGAAVLEGVRVEDVANGPGGVRVRVREPGGAARVVRGDILVGADGLRSVVARRLGLIGRRPRLRKVSASMHVVGTRHRSGEGLLAFGERTIGLAPVTADETLWNATVVVEGSAMARDLGAWRPTDFARLLWRSMPGWDDVPRVVSGPWTSGPFDWPVPRPSAERTVLVGDAAGYFDPLTGQGIRRALRTAELATAAILSATSEAGAPPLVRLGPGAPLGVYARTVRRELAPGRRLQRVVEEVLRRPGARRWFLARAGARERGLDTLIRVAGDEEPVRSLLEPRAWLPLLSARTHQHPTAPAAGGACVPSTNA